MSIASPQPAALPPQNPTGGPAGHDRPPVKDPTSARASRVAAAIPARALAMPLALLAVGAYFALRSDVFLSPRNLSMLAIELSITAVLALGMLLVILPGHIDLSAGSGVGLFGGVAAVMIFDGLHLHVGIPFTHITLFTIDRSLPAWASMLTSTLLACAVWWGMGTLIVKEKVPAFIITLSGLLVFRGLQWLVIHNGTIPVVQGGGANVYSHLATYYLSPSRSWALAAAVVTVMAVASFVGYRRRKRAGAEADGELTFMSAFIAAQLVLLLVLICNKYRGVPLPAVIFAAVAVATLILTRHTPFGRYLYAIGGNEEAAVVSGIPVDRVTIGAFVIMGFVVALTGFLQTSYAGSSTPTVGNLMELDAVAACVIGGTSLKGGRGTVGGVLMGALIMATLTNGMTLLAVGPEYQYIARGLVLALAVWGDVRLGRK